ncbi:MAG: protein kinase, partial [Myxococcales bacterium]|nr:protein kinase [Myxococcales bacterium]
MADIPGYRVTETLARGSRGEVLRAVREHDDRAVVLKTIAADLTRESVARFRREFQLCRRFADDPRGVLVHVLELQQLAGRWIISMEDDGAVALPRWLEQHDPSPDRVLSLAIAMSEALAAIHDHAIVHKDLCLANFVYEPKTGVARLIDFASASELSREQPFVPQLAGLEGTLAYLAPEQSGRINRPIDRRTDLYALGVALYRLATGELPFTSSDPLELIHAHLTRTPRPPHERAPGIGEPLSRIIMTLLAKDPEDRYQSARGLLADLRAFRSDPGQPTLLRTQDRSAVFRVPDRLYGREQERETLLAAMDRVAGGGSEVVVVSGTSGIGKSAL